MVNIIHASELRGCVVAGGYSVEPEHRILNLPFAALLKGGEESMVAGQRAKFEVTYTGFAPEAQAAFQRAVDIWSSILVSAVTIRVSATWKGLSDPRVLGQAGPAGFVAGTDIPGAPVTDAYYPIALASKIAGTDFAALAGAHIEAEFNSNFPNWSFNLDGDTPGTEYDLVSVILHELGHGLGFLGSARKDNQGKLLLGFSGTPMIWDTFIQSSHDAPLFSDPRFPSGSAALKGELTSGQLRFNGPAAVAANNQEAPKLYAPMRWEQGSSYSHLDESSFEHGTPNALMTPQIGMGEVIHDPGPVVLGMLHDMGW